MSFGFSVGDFVAVGNLAFRLYRDCYQIARGAPQEFQLLVNEVSNLSNSMQILQNDVKDPRSTLVQGGEDRVRMVNDIVKGIGQTLKRLEKVAKKYEALGSSSKGRQFWVRLKWSVEFSSIGSLRNKLVYHNTMMNLLLTSVGNSSLQRIELSNEMLGKDLEAIKAYVSSLQADKVPSAASPAVSMVNDDVFKETLSAAFMKNAEMVQPWSTIGVNQWIESGRWWLVLAQMELFTVSAPKKAVPRAAYTNLIKASWILIDVIACHPQVPFLTASTQAEVRQLSAELKNEYSKISTLGTIVPKLSELETQDLRIWESQTTESLLRTRKDPQTTDRWKVAGGEQVLFHRYATFQEPITSSLDGCSVTINGEQTTFISSTDAETLEVLIEATNFYLFERNVEHARLEDLKAYALIFGVKDEFHETVARLSQMVSPTGTHPSNSSHGAPSVVAFSLASQPKASEYLEYLEESIEQRNLSAITSTFFGWAVYCGHTALVSLLFSERVIWYDDLWEELTNEAVMRFIYYCGNEATAQLVLESVLKVPYREKRNFITMLVTAQAKDEKGIGLLLRRSEALKNTKNGWGDSALHIAAERGRDIIVRELLELGWDIDAKGNHGDTPLLAALRSYSKPTVASEPTVAVLLENGASVNGENDRGMRTTHAALTSKLSKQTVQLILEKAFEARLPPKLLQPKGKRRRAEVVVTMDRSLCADIFVDSYHASIERVDRRWHSVGYDAKYLPLSLVWVKNEHLTEPGLDTVCHKFGIIFYACPNTGLDISIRPSLDADIFTSSEVNERWLREWKESHINKQIRFQIVNGGEVSIELESCIDCHSFEAIATDPNAEVVESDVESDIDEASEEGLTDDPDAELVDLDSNLGKERMSNLGWDD